MFSGEKWKKKLDYLATLSIPFISNVSEAASLQSKIKRQIWIFQMQRIQFYHKPAQFTHLYT